MFSDILIPNQLTFGEYLDLFRREQIKHILRLQPTLVKFPQLFIADISISFHYDDPNSYRAYSSSEREFSSGTLTASSKQRESMSLERWGCSSSTF